ncbi:MFS transporter [Oerskovia sp. M15]
MVAYVFVAPLAAAAVARLPRRAVMIGSDVLRMVVALCLPFVGEVWQIYVLIFVLQAASATFTPTFQSVIPEVLPDEDDYTAALSLSRLAYDLEAVLSPMLAAALLIVVPSSALFFGTAAGFVGSALLVASVLVPRRTGQRADRDAPRCPSGSAPATGPCCSCEPRRCAPCWP